MMFVYNYIWCSFIIIWCPFIIIWCSFIIIYDARLSLYGARLSLYDARLSLYGARLSLYAARLTLYDAHFPYNDNRPPYNNSCTCIYDLSISQKKNLRRLWRSINIYAKHFSIVFLKCLYNIAVVIKNKLQLEHCPASVSVFVYIFYYLFTAWRASMHLKLKGDIQF